MRFVPLDEAEQPSSDDRELTFIPLETSEVEQDVIGQREEDISKPFVGARNPRRQAADGRAALTDPRRLDSDTGAGIAEDVSFLAEQRRSLTKANDGRTDVSPVQIEAAAQAGMINRPKDSTPKAGAVESYMGKGLSEQEAKQNADFDAGIRSKLNKPFTPDSDGGRISVDYRPDLEADRVAREGERLAQARESVIDWNRFAKLRDYAEESPVASSLASSFASGLNVLNAPQAILNSVLELGDSLEGVMTGEKGNAAKLPKWGWTEELGKLTQAALPEAARVDLTDAWGTDQFGSVLSAKLAGNSLSMFLSLSSMLAPPLRAVLLPAMGSLATGNAYAQGDSALASVAKGAIEIGSEMLPLRAFDATMKGILNLPAPAQNQIFRLAGQKALEAGAALTINGLTGALEESVAQIGGNAVDRYMQGKNVALTEGVADAALLGGITGKILSMPAVAARASEPVSRESVAARALADELSGRDFDPATAGKAADLIFGTRSVDGSGVNRTGAALVEAERAKLNAMRTKASEDLGAAPDVDSAIAAAETMVSLPATGPVEEFVTAPHAASATLANPVPVPSSDTLEAFVNQTLQNAPAETTADAAAVNPNDTGAAAAVRATDAGVGGALPQPAGVSVADSAVQQGQPDTSGAVDAPAYSLDPRLVPVSQRAPDSVNFAPSLRVVAEDNGRSTVQLVQTPERAQDDQQAIEQLRVAVNRYNPGDGDGIQPFRDFNISDSARGRLDSLLGQFQRIAFVAEQALGVRLRYTQSLNGYGVAYKGNVFIDIPTVLNGDGKNQATGIFLFTAGHEGFHHFETSKNPEDQRVAANFKAVLRSYIKDGVVDARQAFESNANIKAGGKAVTRAYAESEVMADINGAMFIDPEFWGRLYQIDNGSTFRKVLYRMMQSLTKMINAAKKSRLDVSDLVKDVAAVREAAAQAWAQRANNQTPPAEIADEVVQYSRSGQSNFEVAPDPNNEPLSAKWNALDLGDKLRISRTVADKIVPQVLALRGASGKIVEQTGSYLNDTNPSFALRLESGDLQTVSKDLGFVLSQDSMMNISTRPFAGGSKVGAVVISIGDKSFAETKGIYDTIRSKVPEVGGQSFAEGEMVVLNYSDTTTSDLASKIDDALDKLYTVRVEEVYSSFPEKKDYDYASAAIDTGEPSQAGPDIRQRLGGIRAEATRLIEAELPSFSRAGEVTGPAEPAGRPGAGRDAGKGQTVAGAIHYGRQGGLSQLNGTSFGSGIKGAEQERLKQPGTDPRIKKRVYFYLPVAGGIAQPEIGLGAHVYSSDLSGLYDPSSMTPIRGDGNAFEVAVLDAGYRGYVNREQGTAVVLNEDVPVQYLGTADKFTKITRTPTVAKPKQMTRVEGDELVRRPEGQEVIQVVRAGNDLKFAAPSFKMQWGEARVLASEAAVADQVLKDAGSTFQFGEPQFSRDFVESPDDINDLGAFNIDTFDFDAKTDEVIDGDSMADIANEVSEMGFGVKGAVASSPTDWKKVQDKAIKGLTPEAAFPMPDFAENEFGNLTAPVYAGGTQVRLELQPYGLKDEDLWTAAIGGLRINADWGTPLSMRGASRKEAADYLQRMAAAKELTYRKFDFYKAVPAPAAKRIGEFWSAVPDIPGATEFAAGTPTVDGNSAEKLRQIAKARLLGKGYSVQVSNTADFFFMLFKNEKTGEIDEASIQIIGKPRDVGQQSVVLHAITLNKGSGIGKMFYSIANTWANVVGVKVLADPDGLTAVNSVRRTENALSAAARTKGEALIEPGWAQRVYGFDGKAKTPDAKRKNLTRIALAQARNVYELAPDFQGVRYDLDTQTFVNEDGTAADAKVKGIMSRPEVRRFSLGRTSFIRAALTNELVEGEIALPEEMGEPIMYSRAQLDSYMEGRNKTMPTISGAAAQEADIDLAVKAIEAVRAEIERGKRDSLPIPIGRTPHVLNMLGARQKMLRIDTGILRKVLFDKHSEDFADVTPERFVRSIYMPAMVLRGRAANEYEIVTSIVTPRGPIMVPVTDSGNSFAVMSAYAKNVGGGGESLVKRIKDGALLYADPAMAQVALTGRESAPVRGIITSGAQFPSAPPQSAQDSNVSQTDISVKHLNPYYVGWDKVRGDIIGGISSRKVKTDVDLMRRIGNLFKGDWEDAPSFSRNSLGLYSALERGLESLTANSAPANGWKDAIKGLVNKGVAKADEVEWSGVNDWLDLQTGKVSKDSVLEYLRGNGVQVEEVVLGEVDKDFGTSSSEYSKYTLPGGENYREVLLTLPTLPQPHSENQEIKNLQTDTTKIGRTEMTAVRFEYLGTVHQTMLMQGETPIDAARRLVNAKKDNKTLNVYKSPHWDEDNVIAHIRVNDRTDADGKRVLFVEEIQSDWGQDGKKKGFASPPVPADEMAEMERQLANLKAKRRELVAAARASGSEQVDAEAERVLDEEAALQSKINAAKRAATEGVPIAPFVTKTDGWLNLALKRVIAMAVDGGYDRVAFVNGEQSADRYDLSKQVERIEYDFLPADTAGVIKAFGFDGEQVVNRAATPEELPDIIGKEVAAKLMAEPSVAGTRTLTGAGLSVGGEGMKAFYDQIVPNAVKALLKKTGGGQLEAITVQQTQGFEGNARKAPAKAITSEQPGFTITDTMREKVSTEGLPMFSRAQPRQGQNFALPGETLLSQTRRVLQDYFLPVLEVQRAITSQGGSITEASNVYRAEERMYGRVEETLRDFRQREFDPLIREAIDNDITMDELSLYAYAKHAKERNAYIQTLRRDMPDTGSGLSNDEADDILTMFQVNGKTAVMERLHQRLMGITATTRREMLESELITQDEYDQMESQYENYVPLRGFEEVDQNGERTSVQRGGRGFNIRGKETTRALGRRTRAGNIIENIVLDYERAVFRGERNMVGQTFLELIRTNPDPKLWEIDAERTRVSFNRQTGRVNKSREVDSGPNTVAIKVKGREVYVKVYDERLLRAMRKASKDDTGAIEHFINSTAGQFTALLRATLTQYNPVFAFVNAIRDIQSGGVAVLDELGTKGVALYAKHYRAALASAGRHQLGKLSPSGSSGMFFGNPTMDRYFEEYRAAGGTTGGYYGKSAEDVQQEIRNVLLAAGASPKTFAEKLKTMGGTSAGRRIMRGVQSTGKVLEFLGATSENAARVAAYRAARELGKSPAEAASIAKNLTTNFNRKGEWGQAINGAYLFFNAAVQGSHRTLKALKRGRVQALMAGMTATGMASVMLALAVGGDDEDDGQPYWDKIPTFEKERNFIIMLPPGSDMDGTEKVGSNGRYIKIPMPYGFNVFPMLGVQIADVIRNAKDETQGVTPGRGAINMLNAIMGSYNPLGGAIELEDGKRASSVMQAVFPTIGDIIVQQSLGVDGFSRPTSPFKSEFDLDPDSENANVRQAGSVWHMLARSLNTATGGSQAEPGAIDVSPGSLQNLWKNMTGGTGTFLSDVFVNLPTKFFEPEAEITSRDVPLLRNFYGQVDGMNDQSLLYERRREIQRAKTYEKNRADLDMEPTTDPTEVALASLASLSSKFTKEMSKLRREEIDIADDAEMSTAQKNLRKKEIKLERDRLAREFNAAYMDAMRAKRDGEFDQ